MKPQSIIVFTLSTLILGFMLAVQFQTIKNPDERDTRNVWELREDLEKEKQQQVQLNREISQYEVLLNEYQQNSDHDRVEIMEEALQKLKHQAGLTTVSDKGIVFQIEPLFQEELLGEEVPQLTAELLSRLLNELNSFGVDHISIAEQRIISLSAIREVDGETFVNNRPLPDMPIEMKVIAEDTAKLYDQFKASKILDEYAKENLSISSELKNNLYIIPYDRKINVNYMQRYKEGS